MPVITISTILLYRHTIFECDCLNGGGLWELDITFDLHGESISIAHGSTDGGISLE